MELVPRRYDLIELGLNLKRRFANRKTSAIADTEDVCINCNRRLSKSNIKNASGGLTPHTRQRLQRLAATRHLTAVFLREFTRQCDNVLCLGAVKTDRLDQLLDTRFAESKHFLGGAGGCKKRRRRLVY